MRLHLYKKDVHGRDKDIMMDVQQHQIADQTLARRKEEFIELKKQSSINLEKQVRWGRGGERGRRGDGDIRVCCCTLFIATIRVREADALT